MSTAPASPADDLRPYQREALTAIIAALADGGRATAVMACGTGKTLLGVRAAEALAKAGEVIAVFAPSLPLLEQLHNTWRDALRTPHRTILVCSQDDILGETTTNDDETATPVTTNDDTISEYLTATTTATELTVVFCTYHSAPRLAAAARAARTEFALLIADEAHRTAGKKNATFTTILTENQYSARRRLFMTATRRIHTSGADDTLSMDDPALYGNLVYDYPFGRAIAEEWLSDYRVAVVIVTDTDVHRAILNETTIGADGQHFNALRAAAVLALQDACRRHNLHRVLAFHNTVSASRQFTANLRGLTRDHATPIDPYHLDALASPAARRGALKHLAQPQKGHRTVVNNVRVLAEGVDIPALDAVMFAEPKRSQIDVVQAVGRAIRKNPHRSDPSIILLPVYVAPGENPSAVLASSQYRHIWQVIQALRDHDDTLDAQIRNIRRNDYDPTRPTYEPQALPEKITVYGTSLDASEFTSAVETMILNTTTTTWAEGLAQYRIYTQQSGLYDVPKRYVCATGFPLGQWQSHQRQAYRWKRLSQEQIAELEAAGFKWGERTLQWRKIIERINRYDTALSYRLSSGQLSFIDPPAMAWLWSVQDRGRRGLLSPREKDDLAGHDIPWESQELSDVLTPEEAAIFGRPLTQFLNNATKHGVPKAETMPVTIRNKHKNIRGNNHNITRWRGQQIADILRNCAARGALPETITDRIRSAGLELPPPSKPAIDLDTDPDWQNKLLTAVADLYAGRYRDTNKPATGKAPHDNSTGPAPKLTAKQLAAAITGPTMADIGLRLNQITMNPPNLPALDTHATELIQQADCYSNYLVAADHRVLKPSEHGGYTPAGTLSQRIDTVALIRTTRTIAPTLTLTAESEPDNTHNMVAVRSADIPEELETELLQHISRHVYQTLPQLTQRLIRSTFKIRDVKIFNTTEEFTEFAHRAARRNRVIVQIGPQLTDAINDANQTAAKMALAATYEKTIIKLSSSAPAYDEVRERDTK